MNLFFKKLKNNKQVDQNIFVYDQAGMTYIELIVVLGIFSLMSSIVLFNYGKFQAKVDIKNLGSDVALKIVEAQKAAMSGKLSVSLPSVNPWRPSYGIYFDLNNPKAFKYFVDLDQNGKYGVGEVIDTINITKGNSISDLEMVNLDGSRPPTITDLSVDFTRPNSGAILSAGGSTLTGISHVQITVSSPDQSVNSYIKIYPSGRIEVK